MRCCGGRSVRNVNVTAVSWSGWWDDALSEDESSKERTSPRATVRVRDRQVKPSVAGTVSPTSFQYNALVPAHGSGPRIPVSIVFPASSRIDTDRPANGHLSEHTTPTLILNGP